MKFISIDPSLRNTALVYGVIEGDKIIPEGYKLVTTEKSKDKKVRVVSGLVNRCRILREGVKEFFNKHKPDIVFAETPLGAQSFHAGVSYAVSCYLIASVEPPAIEVTPKGLKKGTVGKISASKKEIIEYVRTNYPSFALPMKTVKGKESVVVGKAEHICDAVCVAEVGIQTTQYKQIKDLIKSTTQ